MGRRLRVSLVVAPAADAVVLLGDIGEREEVGERAGDVPGRRNRKRGQLALEGLLILHAALTGALRERAHALDRLKELLALELLQRVAEDGAQQADIVAERLVGVGVEVWRHAL